MPPKLTADKQLKDYNSTFKKSINHRYQISWNS